jgi:hypothetical protein
VKIENKHDAAINRAYRDFNRTLKDFYTDKASDSKETKKSNNYKREEMRIKWNEIVRKFVYKVLNNSFTNQDEFDKIHQEYCKQLIESNNDIYKELTRGQAQKWLNMTLKYLIILEEDGIEINMRYFHIPIDNVIQDFLEAKLNIPKEFPTWSQIDDYKAYLDYQQKVRTKFVSECPILKEMELFNEAIAKLENK